MIYSKAAEQVAKFNFLRNMFFVNSQIGTLKRENKRNFTIFYSSFFYWIVYPLTVSLHFFFTNCLLYFDYSHKNERKCIWLFSTSIQNLTKFSLNRDSRLFQNLPGISKSDSYIKILSGISKSDSHFKLLSRISKSDSHFKLREYTYFFLATTFFF